MRDVYIEQIVKRQDNTLPKAVFGFCAGMVFVNFLLSFVNPLSGILALIFLALSWYLRRFMEIEYEYELTNSILDIDIIYLREKRKNAATIDLSNALSFERKDQMGDLASMRTHSFVSGTQDSYCIVVANAHKKECYIIEPNEELIRGIRGYMKNVYKA